MYGVCHFFTAPFVFIGGSHGQQGCVLQLYLQEPTLASNGEPPRLWLKSVGPMGWSADHPVGPTDLGLLLLG